MSGNFWLSDEQFKKIRPLLPNKSRGVPRVDDQRVLSGIIFCLQRGYRWSDVPPEYGPRKTLYNRYKRWSEAGVFARIFEALAKDGADFSVLMIDAQYRRAHVQSPQGLAATVTAHLSRAGDFPCSSSHRSSRHLVLMSLRPRANALIPQDWNGSPSGDLAKGRWGIHPAHPSAACQNLAKMNATKVVIERLLPPSTSVLG